MLTSNYSDNVFFLGNEIIYLRPFNKEDINNWVSWFNNVDITKFMNKGYFPTLLDEQIRRLESMYQDNSNLQLAICVQNSHKLVGTVGLHDINFIHRHADISILIGEQESHGNGYGKAAVLLMISHAFNKLNLNKLTAGMWSNNLASEVCFKSVGFIQEGRRKNQYFYQGGYVDELNYGLLRSEWMLKYGRF